MINDRTISECRGRLEDYIISNYGVDTRKNFRCLSRDHEDRNPSMSYKDNKIHCFSCGKNWDIFDLVGDEYGLSEFKEQVTKTCELLNISMDEDYTPGKKSTTSNKEYLRRCKSHYSETDYLSNRGISLEVAERFNIGYDPNFKTKVKLEDETESYVTWRVITIPTKGESYIARNTDLTAVKDNRSRKRGSAEVFNYKAISSSESAPIFILEGEIDALSIIEVGGVAIGIGSINNKNKLYDLIEKYPKKHTYVISMDNDAPGQNTSREIYKQLKSLGENVVEINFYGKYKDANEYLVNDRANLEKVIATISLDPFKYVKEVYSVEYRSQKSAYNSLRDFINKVNTVTTSVIATGYNELDLVLDGGLTEGLYIIGAVPSLGKTAYILQMIDQIAERISSPLATEEDENIDILYFSLEMASDELIARSLSRITFQECVRNKYDFKLAKTNRGITMAKRYQDYTQDEINLINKAIEKYSKRAPRIFFIEGVGDISAQEIRDAVEDHIKITGHTPIVVVDYLQILAPWKEESGKSLTDKQSIDKNILELKRISRDHKLPVVCVSSFNREGYKSKSDIMSAFKESGAIEYTADFLAGMIFKDMISSNGKSNPTFELNEAMSKDPREISLYVLKNRNGCIPRQPINYLYKPMFQYFEEDT